MIYSTQIDMCQAYIYFDTYIVVDLAEMKKKYHHYLAYLGEMMCRTARSHGNSLSVDSVAAAELSMDHASLAAVAA
jgi:hypothetical protein